MINEFLDIIKDGYTVEFSENNTLGMTEIKVSKYGKSACHSRSSLRVRSDKRDVYPGYHSPADR